MDFQMLQTRSSRSPPVPKVSVDISLSMYVCARHQVWVRLEKIARHVQVALKKSILHKSGKHIFVLEGCSMKRHHFVRKLGNMHGSDELERIESSTFHEMLNAELRVELDVPVEFGDDDVRK